MSTFIGGTAVGAGAGIGVFELAKFANKNIFLPISERVTEEIFVQAVGEDRAMVQKDIDVIHREVFDPIFGFIENTEESIIHWLEEKTGTDINRDGEIGAHDLEKDQTLRTHA